MECNAKPRVLIADTNRWALSSHLAIRLAESGCEVAAICTLQGHSITRIDAVRRLYPYNAFKPAESLRRAIHEFDPHVVLPTCDRSVEHLHELLAMEDGNGVSGKKCVAVIERSLGCRTSYPIVSSRNGLLSLAAELGIRTPGTWKVPTSGDLHEMVEKRSQPLVVKVDGTWGGTGVRFVRNSAEVQAAWDALVRMSGFTKAVKRLVVNRDSFLLGSWLKRVSRPIIAQEYVDGRPANCSVFAWGGEVKSIICVEVVTTDGLTGPASVVRVVNNPDMLTAAQKIARHLMLSGFFGLDFMIEDRTENVFLVEMNPRLAPPGHLRLGRGQDLVGALCESIGAESKQGDCVDTTKDVIAYFPRVAAEKEAELDYYVDMPVGEPALIGELLNPYPDRTLLFRIAQRLAGNTSALAEKAQFDAGIACERKDDEHPKSPSVATGVPD